MNVSVFGAGAWGTALAGAISDRHATVLWARDAYQVESIQRTRRNERYLPGVVLPDDLQISHDWTAAVDHARDGLLVIATPTAGLSGMLEAFGPSMTAPLLWVCKGFQSGSGLLGHEVASRILPDAQVGILSGPSFAQEVAAGQPTALVAASREPGVCRCAVEVFHSDALRVYTSHDPVGVEVGGAVKNVLAIATGMADGLKLGMNARAALITRGLAEMVRLGVALGARTETFMGLSGLGDLVLTATGDLSRNRTVGLKLAEGEPLADILSRLGHVAEGVASAATVLHRARSVGVDMPIASAVVDVLEGRQRPLQAVEQLMGRQPRAEH
jgi:glycerol-3-phosphate dehydrogenase (NAD(P)+)